MNSNTYLEAGTRVRVLPGYTACNGKTPNLDGSYSQIWVDAWRDGGIFYIDNDGTSDDDGDYRVRTAVPADDNVWGHSRNYIHHAFVELAPEAELVPAESTVRASEAFKPGNEIEFTVHGVNFLGSSIIRGCKTLDITADGALAHIVKMDRDSETATFRATISGSGVIEIPGGGTINSYEANTHFNNIKITKLADPPRPNVRITFTAEQADKLTALLGTGIGNMDIFDLFLDAAGEHRDDWRIVFDGKDSYRIVPRP